MYSAEYFHSSASLLLTFVSPLGTLHLVLGTSVWRQSGAWLCRLEQVEEHIVDQLMMRVSALSLLEETQAAASRSLTPLLRPGKQISKHMQYVFNPVEHFISQQTQITLRDIHIL